MRAYRRILPLFLASLMLMPSFAGCGRSGEPGSVTDTASGTAERGSETMKETETSVGPEEIDPIAYITYPIVEESADAIVDFGNASFVAKQPGLSSRLSTVKVFEDAERGIKEKKSMRVNASTGGVNLGSLLVNDWSDYESIEFSVYSQKATGAKLQLRFNNRNTAGTKMAPYYRIPFTVEWTGWKTFCFDLSLLSGNYNPHRDGIVSMALDTSGWDLSLTSDTTLYLGNIYMMKKVYEIKSDAPIDPAEVCTEVKDKWRAMLIGDPEPKAEVGDAYLANLKKLTAAGKTAFERYVKAGDKKFGYDVTFGKNGCDANVNSVYVDIEAMAVSYAAVGSDLYHDPALLDAIKEALAYGYDTFYGPCVWKKGTYGNWWYWDIGVPLHLTPTLLILEKELGPELCKKYLEPFDYLDYYPSMTACNKIWISECVYISALLQNDVERVLRSAMIMNDVFDYVQNADGFYEDGSFIQHEYFAYSGGYGLSMLNELTKIMAIFHGTRLEFRNENVANQFRWMLETFQPVIYKGRLFASLRGREVSRATTEAAANTSAVVSMARMTLYAPAQIRTQLEAILRGYMLSTGNDYALNMPLILVDYAVNLAKDEKIAPRAEYLLTKVFGMMDRVAFHGVNFGACAALSSTRIQKYEAINNENMSGWYQGDGMLYVYTEGYDYGYPFFRYADPYKMPGTTVSTIVRKEENVGMMLGASPFAGGVESGKYGIAAFVLGYADNQYHKSAIRANKSYFFFDNEIVCIGSGITNSDGYEVRTVAENRLLRAGDTLRLNGESFTGAEVKKELTTAYCSNMGGYYFPTPTEVSARSVKNTNEFFEMWIGHGTDPKDGGYAYVLLPGSDEKQTEAYAASPDIRILEKSSAVHAVREEKLGITGYVFFEKAESGDVKVSAPCAITVRGEKEGKTVTFSDPTHLLETLTVTLKLDGVSRIVSADEKVSATVENGVVTLTLDAKGNIGQTFTVTVK